MTEYKIIFGVILFIVLISIQYTLNRILFELKEVKRVLIHLKSDRKI